MHSYATPCTSRILSIVQLIQSKVTTGAFEIAVDGQVVFSKLQMGRFPEADDLIKIFSATK
jgi:selT/selW/selH-like putative selenoprotein